MNETQLNKKRLNKALARKQNRVEREANKEQRRLASNQEIRERIHKSQELQFMINNGR